MDFLHMITKANIFFWVMLWTGGGGKGVLSELRRGNGAGEVSDSLQQQFFSCNYISNLLQ